MNPRLGLAPSLLASVAMAVPICLTSCAHPQAAPPPPLLPTAVDVDKLVPTRSPAPPERDQLQRYPDIAIDEGDCPGKPAGVLVSDGRRADLVEIHLDRNRLVVTERVLRELRAKEWDAFRRAEAIHLQHIAELEGERQRQARWAPWRFWAGVAAGAGAVLAGAWAIGQAR